MIEILENRVKKSVRFLVRKGISEEQIGEIKYDLKNMKVVNDYIREDGHVRTYSPKRKSTFEKYLDEIGSKKEKTL
jgi:hypothetical protein